MQFPLAPELLFGSVLRETPFRFGSASPGDCARIGSFADGVPEQEFGNEENTELEAPLRLTVCGGR